MTAHASHPNIVKRLKRAEGHLRKIISMIEKESPCLAVAQQLEAVVSALDNAKRVYIEDHIEHCLDESHLLNSKAAKETLTEFKQLAKYL